MKAIRIAFYSALMLVLISCNPNKEYIPPHYTGIDVEHIHHLFHIDDSSMYYLNFDGQLVKYNIQTKKKEWTFDEAPNFSGISTSKQPNNFMFTDFTGSTIYCIDSTGKLLTLAKTQASHCSKMLSDSLGMTLACISEIARYDTNGTKIWSQRCFSASTHCDITFCQDDLNYYVIGLRDSLDHDLESILCINKLNGNIAWSKQLNAEVNSPISLSRDSLYFTLKDGRLYSLNKANGNIFWSDSLGAHQSKIIPHFNKLLFVVNYSLYCYNIQQQKTEWVNDDYLVIDLEFTYKNNIVLQTNTGLAIIDANTGNMIRQILRGDSPWLFGNRLFYMNGLKLCQVNL